MKRRQLLHSLPVTATYGISLTANQATAAEQSTRSAVVDINKIEKEKYEQLITQSSAVEKDEIKRRLGTIKYNNLHGNEQAFISDIIKSGKSEMSGDEIPNKIYENRILLFDDSIYRIDIFF